MKPLPTVPICGWPAGKGLIAKENDMRKGPLLLLLFAISLPGLAQSASQRERNKAVAQSFFEEVLSQGRLDKYGEFHSKDFVGHSGDRTFTLEEDLAYARGERKALPDMSFRVNRMIAEGDLVAVHITVSGTNTQAGMGFPATGKKIESDGVTIFRFKDGKICEEWNVFDMLKVMRQTGLLPPETGVLSPEK
ncbi:MAG: ester cyclase [Terriglobales bacterium]